jgi:hypothetical protein
MNWGASPYSKWSSSLPAVPAATSSRRSSEKVLVAGAFQQAAQTMEDRQRGDIAVLGQSPCELGQRIAKFCEALLQVQTQFKSFRVSGCGATGDRSGDLCTRRLLALPPNVQPDGCTGCN